MERVSRLLAMPAYRHQLDIIELAEKDRIYCGHDLEHFLDVARIMQLINLKEALGLDEELIYAAALMHDIGRGEQYATGEPHDLAGCRLCREMLPACGFTGEETDAVCEAVSGHSQHYEDRSQKTTALFRLLKTADHVSRNCFLCPAADTCHWPEDKKNKTISL